MTFTFFFGFLQVLVKLFTPTTYCLYSFLPLAVSSAFLTPNILRFFFILSAHLHLGLFVFGFHTAICSISLSNHHTCLAQLICLLLKVPIMLSSLYNFSILLLFVFHTHLHNFFLDQIFFSMFFSQTLLTFIYLILSWPKCCMHTE